MTILLQTILFFAVGFVGAFVFEKITKKWALWDKKIGWQIHHSLIGVLLIALALFFREHTIALVASGIGIITQHSIGPDGFVFIKRW